MKNIAIHKIEFGSYEYRQALALREEILRKPLGLSVFDEDLQRESGDIHICASIGGRVIGVLVLTAQNCKVIKMRQVAVLEEYRNNGIGSKMLRFAEREALAAGFCEIVVHARKTAVDFYEKHGYQITSGPFIEVKIPHFEMKKRLCPVDADKKERQ